MTAAVRALFVAAPLLFAAQIVAVEFVREPYPALFQPAFGGGVPKGGVASTIAPVFVATYPDGTTAEFDHLDVMAQAQVTRSFVVQSTWGQDTPRRTDPDNAAWLRERLARLGDGREPVSATIEWRRTAHDLSGQRPPATEVARSVVVDLEEAPRA